MKLRSEFRSCPSPSPGITLIKYNDGMTKVLQLNLSYILLFSFILETLPRTKKRVRKSSADPRMSLTSDLFMTPPTSRINRSMSNPVTSLDLNSSSPLLMRSITPTVAEEPDVLALDMSQSSLLDTHNSLHDPSLDNEINRPALAEFSIGCENNDNQSIVISSSPPISPINTICEELSDELTENSRHNENLSPRKNDNIVEVEETLSPEPSDSVIIPSVQITDTDDDDSRCSTLNDTTLALGASNDGAEHQVVPTPEEDECVHDIEGVSAIIGFMHLLGTLLQHVTDAFC